MKLYKIFIIYALIMLAGALFVSKRIEEVQYQKTDMVDLNTKCNQIYRLLDSGKSIQNINEQFDCNIIKFDDPYYESLLMNAENNGKVVLDLKQNGEITGRVVFNGEGDVFNSFRDNVWNVSVGTFIIVTVAGLLLILTIWLFYVHPFVKLKNFSSQISKGNLDMPLEMTRGNYFGVFTESFDIMREELKAAREGEYKANVSKKEMVAELSHDIKTPVSTIKAACEVIQCADIDNNIKGKIDVIEKKADMINNLINNLFHATLEELTALKVDTREEMSTVIPDMLAEMQSYSNINMKNSIHSCLVYMDHIRFNQVIDNIVYNSFKYAGTDIDVEFSEDNESLTVKIADHGPGVSEDELALITEKFYRGKNANGKSGSGLGLYLAGMFMKQMKGTMEYYNDNGFVVILKLKKV